MIGTGELKNEIEKGYRAFKAFEKGVEVMKALEALEQNEKETERRIAELKTKESNLQKITGEATQNAQRMEKQAADNLKAAELAGKNIVEDARARAQRIVEDAKAEAKVEREGKEREVVELIAKSADLSKECHDLGVKNAAARKELADIEAAVKSHREALQKFVKG